VLTDWPGDDATVAPLAAAGRRRLHRGQRDARALNRRHTELRKIIGRTDCFVFDPKKISHRLPPLWGTDQHAILTAAGIGAQHLLDHFGADTGGVATGDGQGQSCLRLNHEWIG